MDDKEIKKVEGGVITLLPMTAGLREVISYNLPDVKQAQALPLGLLRHLPRQDHQVERSGDRFGQPRRRTCRTPTSNGSVHRADGSGTTFVFTTHLSAISPEWKSGPGTGKTVNWPAGVGGKGNEGVTALLKQTPGSIGYIEYGYAINTSLPMAQLENKAGKYVSSTPDSAAAALASVQMPADLRAWAPDPEGDASYPIVTYTWLLVHPSYSDAAKRARRKAWT